MSSSVAHLPVSPPRGTPPPPHSPCHIEDQGAVDVQQQSQTEEESELTSSTSNRQDRQHVLERKEDGSSRDGDRTLPREEPLTSSVVSHVNAMKVRSREDEHREEMEQRGIPTPENASSPVRRALSPVDDCPPVTSSTTIPRASGLETANTETQNRTEEVQQEQFPQPLPYNFYAQLPPADGGLGDANGITMETIMADLSFLQQNMPMDHPLLGLSGDPGHYLDSPSGHPTLSPGAAPYYPYPAQHLQPSTGNTPYPPPSPLMLNAAAAANHAVASVMGDAAAAMAHRNHHQAPPTRPQATRPATTRGRGRRGAGAGSRNTRRPHPYYASGSAAAPARQAQYNTEPTPAYDSQAATFEENFRYLTDPSLYDHLMSPQSYDGSPELDQYVATASAFYSPLYDSAASHEDAYGVMDPAYQAMFPGGGESYQTPARRQVAQMQAVPDPTTGKELFRCPEEGCTYSSPRRSNLQSHQASHSTERPYVCSACSLAFARKHDMQRHARSHEPVRQYVCQVGGCQRAFTRGDALKRHHDKMHPGEAPPNTASSPRHAEPVYAPQQHLDMHHHHPGTATDYLPAEGHYLQMAAPHYA